jgi:Na+-driven multidrug efflux pump
MATKITKRGMVFFANELFWVIGMTLLSLSYAQREGVNILDSLSIVGSIGNIFNILFQGLSIGIGVMVGSYLGEGNFKSAKDYAKKVYWLGFLASIILGVLIILLSPVIPLMFSKVDPSQKAYASKMLIAYGMLIWGSCLYCCCYVTLKTGGEALTTFFIDSGLMWGVAVPLSWILVKFTNLELLYVYAIVVGIDILKFFVSYIFVKKEKWVKNLTVTE